MENLTESLFVLLEQAACLYGELGGCSSIPSPSPVQDA